MNSIKPQKQRNRAGWLTCALSWLITAVSASGQMIELRSNESVRGAMVLLRDIAHVPHALPEPWRDREIIRAPQPGQPMRVSLTEIAAELNRYPDMRNVVLRGESHLALARAGTQLASEQLHAAIYAYASEQPRWQETELHVECENEAVEIAFSNGQSPDISIQSMMPEDRPNHYRFSAEIAVPGAETRNVSVSARIEPMQQVWVAGRTLARGHVLEYNDLDTAWMLPSAARTYLPGEEPIVGMEVNREIRARQPLSSHFLVSPISAKRGDTVNVTAVRGGLQVALRATALATGRRGERILCMNEVSRRRFLVRLTDVREATVDF